MGSTSPIVAPPILSPLSSPNTQLLLQKRVAEWSQETGLNPLVRVRVVGKVYDLHRSPLVSKSGYFRRALADSSAVELPENFPGGSETFEMVALFSYDSPLLLDPFNVASIRCAAEFLQMTEDIMPQNLSERSDLYLTQIVLQNWDDSLIVLQKCLVLSPWSEELFIVSRCVESLAFMLCMEILDPDQSRDQPVVSLDSLSGRAWNCDVVKEIAGKDLWIKDLVALPFEFFQRIINSLRRQGMKEKYVSPLVVFYSNKWVLSKKTYKFWESSAEEDGGSDANSKATNILEGILKLLPPLEMAGRVIPASFYIALLERSLILNLSAESRTKLEDQVASILYLAKIEDFLLPDGNEESERVTSSAEFMAMERVVKKYLRNGSDTGYSGRTPFDTSSIVAELWDSYLSQVAFDQKLDSRRFTELIGIIPMANRENHDHLYLAMSTFFMHHPNLSSEEKALVCKYLNCHKLSQETCVEVVQNDQMPLRLIVQALFVQQLNTHQAFKDYSDSFRLTQFGDYSGSFSRCQLPKIQILEETPCVTPSLESLIAKEIANQKSGVANDDYESTSFRIQELEQEIMVLKRKLLRKISQEWEQRGARTHSFGLTDSDRTRVNRAAGGCITSISWGFQRKYTSRLLKVLRKLALFGKGRWKVKKK